MKDSKTSLKNIIKIFIALFLLVAVFLLMRYLNNTTLFTDTSVSENGYLTFDDYLLRDEYDADFIIQNPKSLREYDRYVSRYEGGQTSKGVTWGVEFTDFVKIYGSYMASSIDVYDPNVSSEERTDEYYDTHYLYDLTVNEFLGKSFTVEECIEMDATVSVTYSVYVKGGKVAYSSVATDRLYNELYDTFWPKGSILNPNVQSYRLVFGFEAVDGKLILTFIDSYRYNY